MSCHSGVDIVTNGLVFAFDMANTQQSWKGAPTTNLVSSSDNLGTGRTNSTACGTQFTDFATGGPNGNDPFVRCTRTTTTMTADWHFEFGYSSVPLGTTLTFSCYARSQGGTPTIEFSNPDAQEVSFSLTGEWKRYSTQFTAGVQSNLTIMRINRSNTNTYTIGSHYDIADAQLEISAFPTPYVAGTRSNTQALLDLTKNNNIIANSLTYSSDGTFSFNGSTNYLRPNISHSYKNSSCLEVVFKSTSHGIGNKTIIGYAHNGGYSNPTLGSLYINGTTLSASLITAAQVYRIVTSPEAINVNQVYHVCLNKNTITGLLEIYVNGVLKGSQTFDAASYAQWTGAGNWIGQDVLDIGKSTNNDAGQGWSTDYFSGNIYVAKVYSRVLSTSEIQQNFNALKGRYGL